MATKKQLAARKKFAANAKAGKGKVGKKAVKKGSGKKKGMPAFLKKKK